MLPGPGSLVFRCNLCGGTTIVQAEALQREAPSCHSCHSTARERAIVRALSVQLFGSSVALPDWPERRDLRGIGMTDSPSYAVRLEGKLSYRNTYYHQEPQLDIAAPQLPREFVGACDFVISSEVLEHVAQPVQRAFDNIAAMLRPGGVLVLTVPYGIQPHTIEHFPPLNNAELVEENGQYVLRNRTTDERVEEFRDLVFHGGPGSTLEMRVFAEADLLQHLAAAGFVQITVHRGPDFQHGIWWPEPWSLPITARIPGSS